MRWAQAQAQAAHGDGLHITYSTVDSLEIMAGGVNKGVALAALLESLGLTAADCLAFGDNLNDTEMLLGRRGPGDGQRSSGASIACQKPGGSATTAKQRWRYSGSALGFSICCCHYCSATLVDSRLR